MSDLLPPFDDIDLALEDIGAAQGAAAIHGLLSGLACAGAELPDARLCALMAEALDVDLPADTVRDLLAMNRTLRSQFEDEDLGFELLLPEDDQPLADRVRCMAEWCDGFLGGFGQGSGNRSDADLTPDVRDLIASLGEFTRAEVGDETEGEEAERDFAELVEYLRIAAMTIFTEMALQREPPPVAPVPAPGLH